MKLILFAIPDHRPLHKASHYSDIDRQDEEISALLQFKQSFVINMSASYYEGSYPKTSSWQSNISCCSCDEETSHMIGLDLSSSCLYGSFNSSNNLFHLVHLERLNLADNNFKSSQIPPTITNFPRLRYLNLSYSSFSGHVPSQVSQLSKLSSLDLSANRVFSNEDLLRTLAQNLTRLETLDLSFMNISSIVPQTLANLSHLTSLVLYNCALFGKLPFSLGNLRYLNYLELSSNKLTGQIPASLGNHTQLTKLRLQSNQLSGSIPASLGNLIRVTASFGVGRWLCGGAARLCWRVNPCLGCVTGWGIEPDGG